MKCLRQNWKTTITGLAEGANALVMAFQVLKSENQGMVFVEPKLWARFLAMAAILRVIAGMVAKDANGNGKAAEQPVPLAKGTGA